MDRITLWARNGEAVRQAIELGELVHLETASEAFTDALLLFAIESGVSQKWAEAFPDPREEPEIGMEGMLPAQMAGRFAARYSFRKTGYVLRSARVLGALGSRVEVVDPAHGLSLRGTSDATLFHGDVVRKLLVKREQHVAPTAPLRLPAHEPKVPVNVRQRASRRAVKEGVDAVEAEARAQRVAAQLMAWYNAHVGPSLREYAGVGTGRRIHILDTTGVQVPLETGTYECRGVVKHDDGSRSRGDTLATLRTLLDHAGLMTQVGLCPIQVHDGPLCGPLLETAPVWRAGDLLLEDRGVIDGDTITVLKQKRHVDVVVPLQSTMLSSKEAIDLANMHDQWQPHPSRQNQQIAFVKGVDHLWEACGGPVNACVMRDWNRKKEALDHSVLVTTEQRLHGTWMVRHDEERPEIAHDYAQMKSGGWQLKKRSATRYSELVLYMLTVLLRYSLSICLPTQRPAHVLPTRRVRPWRLTSFVAAARVSSYMRVALLKSLRP